MGIDEDGAEAYCRMHWHPLARTLGTYTGDVALGQDLAQEALARAVARWPRVRRMRSPGGYAYRIGINLARDAIRRRMREVPTQDRALHRQDPRGGAAGSGSGGDAAEADGAAVRLDVAGALDALPPRQRLAVSLRYLADLSIEDTATAMGCRPGTVKALCHQAGARLRASSDLDGHRPVAAAPAPPDRRSPAEEARTDG